MRLFYIYNYSPEFKGNSKPYTATFLFIPNESFNQNTLSEELKQYFQSHLIPDDLFVLGGKDILHQLKTFFVDDYPRTFQFINQAAIPKFKDNVYVLTFDKNGNLDLHSNVREGIIEKAREIIDDGLRKVFIDRGGLIQSRYSHHFVFPSGKHSESFLRTGNILLYGPEIYFIAWQLLGRYNPDKHKIIFCDSSSISSLAYALIDLKRRFQLELQSPSINSFKSYSVFEEDELTHAASALILISSSTSGGIISRLIQKMKSIEEKNVVLLYFLGKKSDFEGIRNNVVCNLDKAYSKTATGLVPFETFTPDECSLCKEKRSLAVNVVGDIFLSENPKIDRVILSVKHAPTDLARFADHFIVDKADGMDVVRCHFKETEFSEERHDIFIDLKKVFEELRKKDSSYFARFKKLLFDKIRLHVPAHTRYIITVEDEASILMAEMLQEQLATTQITVPDIVHSTDIAGKIDKEDTGVIVVVSSCMLSGRNLLLISKQLRQYDKYSIVYLVGLVRTRNRKNYEFVRSNLVQTAKGKILNSFVEVENICIPDAYVDTIWQREIAFLSRLIDYLEINGDFNSAVHQFYSKRRLYLESVDKLNRGLTDRLFYGSLNTSKELTLNKNFAFLEAEIHGTHNQAEVYFIISMIINHLRQSQHAKDTLIQTEYCRQIIDPSNFLRYNDGIIQASLLRAAHTQELAFDLDQDSSAQMNQIIENEIKLFQNGMDEALHEFIYALTSGNLRLKPEHIANIFKKVKDLDIPLLTALCDYYCNEKIRKHPVLPAEPDAIQKMNPKDN
jgi:hypothetical protein